MRKFDLMKDKPELDEKTLNYVWDMLWRTDYCNDKLNAEKRAVSRERERIMKRLEELA